jgi:hypothetical protein
MADRLYVRVNRMFVLASFELVASSLYGEPQARQRQLDPPIAKTMTALTVSRGFLEQLLRSACSITSSSSSQPTLIYFANCR